MVHANVHTTDQNRRTFARQNISGLSAFSLERMPGPSCRPTYCSMQLIMPIDRVGIGPARPCMLMCERTSVSPPCVSASYTQTQTHTQTYTNTYAQSAPMVFTFRREISVCERTRARQVSRYSYVQYTWKKFCQTYDSFNSRLLFLIFASS